MNKLELFQKLGMDASYHFADDSGSEWSLGYQQQRRALDLYESHPELQEEMRDIAKSFLWTLDSALRERMK